MLLNFFSLLLFDLKNRIIFSWFVFRWGGEVRFFLTFWLRKYQKTYMFSCFNSSIPNTKIRNSTNRNSLCAVTRCFLCDRINLWRIICGLTLKCPILPPQFLAKNRLNSKILNSLKLMNFLISRKFSSVCERQINAKIFYKRNKTFIKKIHCSILTFHLISFIIMGK